MMADDAAKGIERILKREPGTLRWVESYVDVDDPEPGDSRRAGFPYRQLQSWVGGLYQAFDLGKGLVAIGDEEGLPKDLPHNGFFFIHGTFRPLVGTIVIVRRRGHGLHGLRPGDESLLRQVTRDEPPRAPPPGERAPQPGDGFTFMLFDEPGATVPEADATRARAPQAGRRLTKGHRTSD